MLPVAPPDSFHTKQTDCVMTDPAEGDSGPQPRVTQPQWTDNGRWHQEEGWDLRSRGCHRPRGTPALPSSLSEHTWVVSFRSKLPTAPSCWPLNEGVTAGSRKLGSFRSSVPTPLAKSAIQRSLSTCVHGDSQVGTLHEKRVMFFSKDRLFGQSTAASPEGDLRGQDPRQAETGMCLLALQAGEGLRMFS